MAAEYCCYPILPAPGDESVTTALVVARVPVDKTQRALGLANSTFPLPESLRHLKRVRSGNRKTPRSEDGAGAECKPFTLVVMGVTPDGEDRDRAADWDKRCAAFLKTIEKEGEGGNVFNTAEVPAVAPTSQESWTMSNAIWPLAIPKPRIPDSHPQFFTPQFVALLKEGMNRAVQLAQESFKQGCAAIGAAVIDPEAGRIVSAAGNTLERNHQMVSAYAMPEASFGEAPAARGDPGTRGRHAVFEAVRLASVARREQLDSTTGGADGDETEQQRSQLYLCGGLFVVTTHEPCAMCCMAMVHSRVAGAFFALPNRNDGSLESLSRMHLEPSLNHRFPAYGGLFEADVEADLCSTE